MPPLSSVSALLLLPTAISAITLGCDHIRADGKSFNFKALGGPKDVNWIQDIPPSITNTTFTIDICAPLQKTGDKPDEECPGGTVICGVQRVYGGNTSVISEVIPIAAQGIKLSPTWESLKDSSSHSDSELEGVRGILHGGKSMRTGKDQQAIIEFVCDHDKNGTEGFEDVENILESSLHGSMSKREDAPEPGEDPEKSVPEKALRVEKYEDEKDIGTLRLTWKTRYACEDAAAPEEGKKSSGLGFFGWFFTIVFLGIAAYIIFGSWLNYNRYGARGWDLIPHGDTIRDMPYIVKDLSSGMMDRLKGGSSRGGYSAV